MADLPVQDLVKQGRQAAAGGQLDEACTLFLQAAAKASGNVETLTQIGAEIIKINRFGKAHGVLLEASKADPDFLPATRMLGNIYLFTGKPKMAADCFGKVLEKAPDDTETWFSLGRAQYEAKELEKALAAFQFAFDQGNHTAGCYRMLLIILENLNRLDEMKEVLGQALDAHGQDNRVQILAAKYDARTGNQAAALARLEKIDVSAMKPEFAAAVLYDTGKALDKTGQAAKAFEAFAQANQTQKKSFEAKNFSMEKSLGVLKDMDGLDLETLKAAAPASEGKKAPVFLIGFPRSGTTLLNRILAAHSQVDVMEERPALFLVQKSLRQGVGPYPGVLASLTDDQTNAARATYFEALETIGKVDPAKAVIDKLPLNIIQIPLIYKLFPGAKIIFALRHPCDACLSGFMQNFGLNDKMAHFLDLESTVGFYTRVMSLWNKYAAALALDVHTIRYEAVVENLQDEAGKLLSFLGLDWEDGILDYHIAARREGYLRTPSYAQVVQPIYTRSAGRWQAYRRFLEPHFDTLRPFCEQFGYDLEEEA